MMYPGTSTATRIPTTPGARRNAWTGPPEGKMTPCPPGLVPDPDGATPRVTVRPLLPLCNPCLWLLLLQLLSLICVGQTSATWW